MRTGPWSLAATATLLTLTALLGACSDDDSGGATVTVTATDDSCEVSETELSAGAYTFEVTNEGSEVTELYVYGAGDEILGEVENVGPGITQQLDVDLEAGSYEAACKPGMTGDGIRTPFTVS